MKKMSILFLFSIIIFWSAVAIAAEPFFGEWEHKDSEKSVIYAFGPTLLAGQVGQGEITVFSSKQKQLVFPFLYTIERNTTASSEIDIFWEYSLRIWFPSQNETVMTRISFSQGKVSISEGDRNLIVVKK